MDICWFCGGRLDPCNESEIVCPWCGEADPWPNPDRAMESGFDFDEDIAWEDTS